MKLYISTLILPMTLSFIFTSLALAHGPANTITCQGVKGLKVMADYKPNGTPFISKQMVAINTSFSEELPVTHLAVEENKFKSKNVDIKITVLDSKANPIKTYILKTWTKDKNLPGYKISKINIHKFLDAKVIEAYDKFANLSATQKSRIKIETVPFDAKIEISNSSQTPFCSYIYKYGSVSPY